LIHYDGFACYFAELVIRIDFHRLKGLVKKGCNNLSAAFKRKVFLSINADKADNLACLHGDLLLGRI
jgi:hypothetical protein